MCVVVADASPPAGLSTKSKINIFNNTFKARNIMTLKGKMLPKEQRDGLVREYCLSTITQADMCRHSGNPTIGLLMTRSVYPILVGILFRRRIGDGNGKTVDSMLESLKCRGVIDDASHDQLRLAAIGTSEYASGRNLHAVLKACDTLAVLTKPVAAVKPPKVTTVAKSLPKPSRWRRWATAAMVVMTLGASS